MPSVIPTKSKMHVKGKRGSNPCPDTQVSSSRWILTLLGELSAQSTKQLYRIVENIKTALSLPGANSRNSVCVFCVGEFPWLFSSARLLTPPRSHQFYRLVLGLATTDRGGPRFSTLKNSYRDLTVLTRCDEMSLL
ncbi:hypothetical protein RRG08_038955 [Elysia crispata]|uniref:Uncharacterized protein n=1 Tax=Elysia crispata TaxID=231223 RepID=A0AAE1CTS2_9GAST|nr:hypothetical protein RRG08_038955 [Elysia crispata]